MNTVPASGPTLQWVKSRRCESSGCVEVAVTTEAIHVRNSTNLDGPMLSFTRAEWAAFIGGVHDGDFDLVAAHTSEA